VFSIWANSFAGGVINLNTKVIHLTKADKLDDQSQHRLELKEGEKVKTCIYLSSMLRVKIFCHK
jgi:hypothetical protein